MGAAITAIEVRGRSELLKRRGTVEEGAVS
jgi:hypothetical protein